MLVNYTETLETLLANQGYGTADESQSLTTILGLMDKFPKFVFNDDIELSMKEMFIDKYDIKEIGAETEELFMHFWKEKTNELLVKYVPKMQMWLDNFNNLFKFSVQLTIQDNEEISNDNTSQNTYYLNPVNGTTTNLKVNDVDKNENNGTRTRERTITRDALQAVWGKTRADIMSKILEVRDVFNECLLEFNTIFMGVL